MKSLVAPELLQILACPDCSGNLIAKNDHLSCDNCKRILESKNGIPILYSKKTDISHFQEEIKLANMMRRPRTSRKDQIMFEQWNLSKIEFWNVVNEKMRISPQTMINIGCGYDLHFRDFQENGTLFVNFDIVQSILNELKDQHGARFCVAGDVAYLPFKEHVFDSVVCADILHHLEGNLSEYIKSLKRLLKPHGMLFVEDPNAFGLYQLPKSLLLPKSVHRYLRSLYHRSMGSTHKPADYEFPLSVWTVKNALIENGFRNVTVHKNRACPNVGSIPIRIYQLLIRYSEQISKYHNFHYLISAEI